MWPSRTAEGLLSCKQAVRGRPLWRDEGKGWAGLCQVQVPWGMGAVGRWIKISSTTWGMSFKNRIEWFPCHDDAPKRNPVLWWYEYETILGRKYECKLGEIQLENDMTNVKQSLAANMTGNWEKSYWQMVFSKSGQSSGAARSALATTWSDLGKFWGCLWLPDMLQNPKMYDTWGCASHFFSARSLWSKIPRSQGVRSPNPLPKWVGEPD